MTETSQVAPGESVTPEQRPAASSKADALPLRRTRRIFRAARPALVRGQPLPGFAAGAHVAELETTLVEGESSGDSEAVEGNDGLSPVGSVLDDQVGPVRPGPLGSEDDLDRTLAPRNQGGVSAPAGQKRGGVGATDGDRAEPQLGATGAVDANRARRAGGSHPDLAKAHPLGLDPSAGRDAGTGEPQARRLGRRVRPDRQGRPGHALGAGREAHFQVAGTARGHLTGGAILHHQLEGVAGVVLEP